MRKTKPFGARVLSVIVAVIMLVSLVPTVVFAEGNACKIGETEYATLAEALAVAQATKEIVLLDDVDGTFNFGSKTLTLDLNGKKLSGIAENATKTTIKNSGATQNTLAAVGTYGCDVSTFVESPDYAVKADDNTTVYYAVIATVNSVKKYSFDDALTAAAGTDNSIVLVQDVTIGTFNFGGKTVTIDLNGFYLNGEASNATNVTIKNGGEEKATLAVTGTFNNDITTFVADGYFADIYGATKSANTVKKDIVGEFAVKVVTSTTTDRDDLTDATAATVDVYSGDKVSVEIRVYGPRFVAADLTFKWDSEKFSKKGTPIGWEKSGADNVYRYYNAYTPDEDGSYYEPDEEDTDGNMYYVLAKWTFTAKECEKEEYDIPFQVKGEIDGESFANAYIAGSWKAGWDTEAAVALDKATQLTNGYANIIMRKMAVQVEPMTGLVYTAGNQELVKSGFTAKDNLEQMPITDAVIKYAVLDAAAMKTLSETQKTDASGNPLYYDVDGKETTEVTETKVFLSEPAASAYTYDKNNMPVGLDADEYTVFYVVTKPGYAPCYGSVSTSIAKLQVNVTWSHDEKENPDPAKNLKNGTKAKEEALAFGSTDLYADYRDDGYLDVDGNSPIKAKYIDAKSVEGDAVVTITSYKASAAATSSKPADGTPLKEVGLYVYTAQIMKNTGTTESPVWVVDDNYVVTNPEYKVLIDGATISGYSLDYAEYKAENVPLKEVFFDGQEHVGVALDVATDDPSTDENEGATEGVDITYYVTDDFGETWTPYTKEQGIPTFSEPGTYTVKATVSKEKCYDLELKPVTFKINNVVYKTERVDWVTGWDVVFVYTQTANVGFTYDGAFMFNMSNLGYKYDNTENYTYVYGIAVYGNGDTSLVVPTNDYTKMKSIENMTGDVKDNRYNINHSSGGDNNNVDINDLVAVQDIYNVGPTYFNNATGTVVSDAMMAIVLKADVTGNKLVDTDDCVVVKTYKAN